MPYARSIQQFDLSGKLINEFKSIKEAGKVNHITPAKISWAIFKNIPTNDFRFRYSDEKEFTGLGKTAAQIDEIVARIFAPGYIYGMRDNKRKKKKIL